MLLKSIWQEEIVPGQTTVKDSGVYDELGQGMLYIEVSNRGAKNCAILEQRMDSHWKPSRGDVSSKLVVSSSAELRGESHTTENVECAIGVHRKDINARDHVLISTPSESTQIHILNAVSRQSGVHNFDSDISVVEVRNVKLSTDLSNMEHEIDGIDTSESEFDDVPNSFIAMKLPLNPNHDSEARSNMEQLPKDSLKVVDAWKNVVLVAEALKEQTENLRISLKDAFFNKRVEVGTVDLNRLSSLVSCFQGFR
ncbi:hypothetical protein AAG906_030650 [Vitis piasezkii]